MSRLVFDKSGKLIAVDSKDLAEYEQEDLEADYESNRYGKSKQKPSLKKSDSLQFLEEEKFTPIFDTSYWSLFSDNQKLEPLIFSNKKSQEDVVKEIVSLIKKGNKIIFLKGACGTGKSAIALNLARILGKTSIVVHVKSLQRQYENDYTHKKHVLKQNGEKMKIAVITGRENHDSIIIDGESCANPELPENIKISEKNYTKIMDYYNANSIINSKDNLEIKDIRRITIAPANPYWSPIFPESY